jgi:hypothetical protein
MQRDAVTDVRRSPCKVHVIRVRFLMKLEFSGQIFEEYSNIKFNENPSGWSRVVPCGRTDVAKLIVAF